MRNPDLDFVEESDSLPSFTLEDMFYIDFHVPDSEDVLKQFLETVFRWNIRYYINMMRELASGIPMENGGAALKWRRARLADKGFPEFDEAVEIYQYCSAARSTNRWPNLHCQNRTMKKIFAIFWDIR